MERMCIIYQELINFFSNIANYCREWSAIYLHCMKIRLKINYWYVVGVA